MILLLKSDQDFGSRKNISWIFVQNTMQMDLVTRKIIFISVQVIKNLEIGRNLENGVISYQCENWLYR